MIVNPPAFPLAVPAAFTVAHEGMLLRDWFAGQVAAQCIRNALNDDGGWDHHNVAYHAYLIADAMLTEREKPDV